MFACWCPYGSAVLSWLFLYRCSGNNFYRKGLFYHLSLASYLFLNGHPVQRVALSTAANMCKKLPSDAADFVMEAVPLLTNLLHYHDSKVNQMLYNISVKFMYFFIIRSMMICLCWPSFVLLVIWSYISCCGVLCQVLDHASVCLTRIAEAFASSPEKLDELCNHGLVAQAAGLISISNSGGQASLTPSTYTVSILDLWASLWSWSTYNNLLLLILFFEPINSSRVWYVSCQHVQVDRH